MTNRDLDVAVARLLSDDDNFSPFYHQDAGLAVAALKQICDEREIKPRIEYIHKWIVQLLKLGTHEQIIRCAAFSFPLAICKALAGLESER